MPVKQFKIVKRRLKDGTIKTYTYEAIRYKRKGGLVTGKSLLVGKGGKIYQDRLINYFKQLKDKGATPTQIARAKQEFNLWMKQKKEGKLREGASERLTVRSLEARIVKDKYASMFINAGYDLDEAAKLIGGTSKDLLNKDNWGSYEDPLTGSLESIITIGSKHYLFVWSSTYTEAIWRELSEEDFSKYKLVTKGI